jgi:competence ComEA-like helix-hairpin-helix protein
MKALLLSWLLMTGAAVTPVDLNRASSAELCELPGVGAKRAEQIIAQRNKRPFRRTQELLLIRGIGPKSYARLRPLVVVGSVPPASTGHGVAP